MNNLEAMKKERAEMAALKPEFKPQYGNKHKGGDQFRTQTLREIAEHSNVHEIEIHPNIVSELIERERLDRANAFIKSKLDKLTIKELNELQIDINLVMFDEMIADGEAHVATQEVAVSDNKFEEPVIVSDNQFEAPVLGDEAPLEFIPPTATKKKGKK